MADDYYSVLGVDRNSSQEEIKEAYRQKIRQHHPDSGDLTSSKELTKTINRAYEVLGDKESRRTYDRLGHDEYIRRQRESGDSTTQNTANSSEGANSDSSSSTSIERHLSDEWYLISYPMDLGQGKKYAVAKESGDGYRFITEQGKVTREEYWFSTEEEAIQGFQYYTGNPQDMGNIITTECSRCGGKMRARRSEYEKASGQLYCDDCLVPFTCASCGKRRQTIPEKIPKSGGLTCKHCNTQQSKSQNTSTTSNNSNSKSRRGFLYLIVILGGGAVLRLGDELLRFIDDLRYLIPGVDNAARGIQQPAFSVDRTEVVEEGGYLYWELNLDSRSTFEASYTVQSGPTVKLLLLEQSEFRSYEQDSSYLVEDETNIEMSGSFRTEIPSGNYVAVIENPCPFCSYEGVETETSRVDVEMTAE